MQDRHHGTLVLALGWLAACFTAVALGQALRLSPAEAAYAWPLPHPAVWLPGLLMPVALVWTGVTVLVLVLGAVRARALGLQQPWARLLLVQPLLLAFIWLVWPANGRQPWSGVAPEALLLAAAGIVVLMYLVWRRGRLVLGARPRPREFVRDGVILAIILTVGLTRDGDFSWQALISSAVLYPLFALVQMTVMLVMPAADLRRCGLSPRSIALACAVVFGLLHWPNPLLAVVTAAAMFLWAEDHLRGRGLISLALGMGLLGAAFSQALPDTWTAHMRVGPGYIRHAVREDLTANRLWFAPGHGDWDAHPPLPAEFLGALYPGVVGRPLEPQELEVWQKALDRARRRTVIWQFLTSPEYAREQRLGPPPTAEELPPDQWQHWRRIIATLDGDPYWQAHGENWPGYLAGLYEDLLGRKATTGEIAAWTPRLNLEQRHRIVDVLLNHAFQWRSKAPETLSFRALVAPPVPILIARF